MPKVYVTQEVATANYNPAEKFGDVVFLCTAEISGSSGSLHNAKLVNSIRDRFKDYDPAVDFIAPSGSPIISCIVMAIAHEKGTTFNFLKWNNRDYTYTPIKVDIEGDGNVY
jgi:hypothetical protein